MLNAQPLAGRRFVLVSRVFASRHGGSIYGQELARVLLKAGGAVTVVTSDKGDIGQLAGAPRMRFVTLHSFFERTWRAWPGRVLDLFRLWSLVTRKPVATAIIQGDLPRLIYVLLQHRTPLIFVRQDGILACPANHRFLPHSRTVCSRRFGLSCLRIHAREGCFGSLLITKRLGRIAFRMRDRLLLGRLKNFVANSEYIARVHERHATVLYPPLIKAQSAAADTHRRLWDIAFCGRLEAVKGCDEALKILAALPQDYRLHILGDGPQLHPLETLARDLRIQDRLQFHGWVTPSERDRWLSSVGCLLLPSLWDEAFGMVGIEAMAQGTPVVAYDAGGIREWCRPEPGHVVGCGDTHAAARAVLELTSNPPKWTASSRSASGEASERFSETRFESQVLELLEAITSPKPITRA
jgi:glycosyltransferase involved in cell wall biosynthesis